MRYQQERFVEVLQRHRIQEYPPFPNRPNPISAGVLIPILSQEDWLIFMTQRPSTLRDHAGEICFPGGKREPHESLQETALREANEELGIHSARVLGRLSSVPLFTSDFRLVPFVAFIEDPPTDINEQEVEALLPISVDRLSLRPFIEGLPFKYQGDVILSPIFDLQHLMDDPPTQTTIFGGTAIVLYELLNLLCKSRNIDTPPIIKSQRQWPLK